MKNPKQFGSPENWTTEERKVFAVSSALKRMTARETQLEALLKSIAETINMDVVEKLWRSNK
jgi:hypothetical protein